MQLIFIYGQVASGKLTAARRIMEVMSAADVFVAGSFLSILPAQ